MSKGRGKSLVFVEDTQVVLLIKQIIIECLYSGQSHTVAPIVNKTILVLAFKIHASRVVVYEHKADILGWSRIEAQRVLVPPDPRPGSHVLVRGFGLESPSFASSAQSQSAWPSSYWGNLVKPLNCPFNRGKSIWNSCLARAHTCKLVTELASLAYRGQPLAADWALYALDRRHWS